jgi:hypothetical protein
MLYGGTQHNPPARFLSEISGESVEETLSNMVYKFGIKNSTTFSSSSAKPEMTGWVDNLELSDDKEPRYVADFEVGDKIEHSLFGRGTIVDSDGENVAISFGSKGIKKLNASFAPIKKL